MIQKWFIVILCALTFGFCQPVFAQTVTSTTSSTPSTTSTAPPTQNQSGNGADPGSTANTAAQQDGSYESALFIGTHIASTGTDHVQNQQQIFDLEIRSGSMKGKKISVSSDVNSNPYKIQPQPGDKLVVFVQTGDDGSPQFYLEGFDRRMPILWLIICFFLVLVLLAGWQGFKTFLSITLSVGIIGWVLIPSFLKGVNPVPIAMLLATGFTFISGGFIFGWNRKTVATALGTLGGVLMAYIISLIFAHWAHLSGLATEDDRMFFGGNPTLNPQGLLFAGIIIAAMGVIEDVAVSIASGVDQIAKTVPGASFKTLFGSGMVIGKDHMAAMANTLIFAYVGASLSTLLLYSQYGSSWQKFLNFESVSVEIIQALCATIGLVFTVPITAALSAWFCLRHEERNKRSLVHVQ